MYIIKQHLYENHLYWRNMLTTFPKIPQGSQMLTTICNLWCILLYFQLEALGWSQMCKWVPNLTTYNCSVNNNETSPLVVKWVARYCEQRVFFTNFWHLTCKNLHTKICMSIDPHGFRIWHVVWFVKKKIKCQLTCWKVKKIWC